eukprot:CAMPEP_0174744884 /NCGR_PEP_ID=MMETSP1094-20130205/85532_1 /TAXON_ID=156173 /ORGANISM="Chrysochromulina brevifilum, Strain UTEX LB 985" /LENGTH=107 /DNA_ID=CAMNT_0015949361 /DNA_START=29 /DNA_END=348 /DNA_ORIENTATION=-
MCSPGMEQMAHGIREELLSDRLRSGRSLDVHAEANVVVWNHFPSGDPNIRLRIDAIRDKHVVLLMNMGTLEAFFEQLAVLLHLQRFRVPRPEQEYADRKWKGIQDSG